MPVFLFGEWPTLLAPPSRHHHTEWTPSSTIFAADDMLPTVARPAFTIQGYQLYAVDQWLSDRESPLSTIAVDTGDDAHSITVCALDFADPGQSTFLAHVASFVDHYNLEPVTTPDGTLYTAHLSTIPSSLTLIPLPTGDLGTHLATLHTNVTLQRLGCGARAAVSARPPTDAQLERFLQAFQLATPRSGARRADRRVAELVAVTKLALMLLGYLKASDPALADTFLCNSSMAAVASARRDLIDGRPSRRTAAAAASTSAAVATASETETVCDLALVMACVVCVLNWRTKLSMVVKEVTKDPFSDPALFQKKIAAFQRSKSLATSRVLDAPTTTAMDAALAHLSAGTTRVAKLLRARLDDIDPVPTLDNFMRLAGQAERTRALWHGSAKNRIDRLLMDSADLGTSSKVEGLLQGGREFATSFFKGGGSGSGAHGGGPGSSTPGGGGGEFTGTGLGGATSATVGLGGAGSSGDFGSRYQPFGDTLAIGDASSGIPSGSGSRFGRRRPRERKTSGGGGGHKKKNSSGSGKLGIPRILQPPPVGTTSRPRSRSGSSGGGEEESDPEEERRTTTATGRAGVLELASSILGRRGSDHSRTMAAAASAGASSAGGADSMPAADTLIPLPISNPFSRRHVKKARRAARETVSAVTESAGAAVHAVTGTASHLLQSASIGLARGPSAAPAAAGLAAIRPMSPNSRNAMFPSPVASSMVLGSPTSLSAMTGAPGSWYPANTSIMASFHPSVSMYLPSLAPSHGADRAVLPAPQELPPEYAMRVFRSRVQRDARTRRAVSLTRPPPDDQVALADAVYVRRRTRSTGSAPSLEGAAMAGRHAWTREAWAPQRPVDAVGRDVSVVREQMAALLHSNHFIHVGLNELEAIALQLERDHYQLQQVYHAKQLDVEALRQRAAHVHNEASRVVERADDMQTQLARAQYASQTAADKVRDSDEIVTMLKEGVELLQLYNTQQSTSRLAVFGIALAWVLNGLYLAGDYVVVYLILAVKWLDNMLNRSSSVQV